MDVIIVAQLHASRQCLLSRAEQKYSIFSLDQGHERPQLNETFWNHQRLIEGGKGLIDPHACHGMFLAHSQKDLRSLGLSKKHSKDIAFVLPGLRAIGK